MFDNRFVVGGGAVLQGRVVRTADEVTCTGARSWLRARPAPEGGLRIEAAERVEARWRRVDHDLTLLVRATLRLLVADPDVAARFAAAAGDLAGVQVDEPDPVLRVVRATYPLLATRAGERRPAVPATLPTSLQPAFRRAEPRDAARLLFGDRATRPVVRTFCASLERAEVPDLFALTVVAAVAPVLQPDHLAALLSGNLGSATAEFAPLSEEQMAGLGALIGPVDARRARRLLAAALADDADRQRLRFVAGHRADGGPSFADVGDWEGLALSVALASDATGEVVA